MTMPLIADFIQRFKADDAFANSVIDAVNAQGAAYFGGYVSPYIDVEAARNQLRAYTKPEFIAQYEDETNMDYDEELQHTAFSDAYRHAVVVDMSEPAAPVVLPVTDPRFAGMTKDRVFTWTGVAALAVAYPSMFVLHADTEDTLLLSVPVVG